MRLLRSRATKLLEQHLQRIGLERFWWRSAKSAIAYCEAGEWFEPIHTDSGPMSARDVVRIYDLEPFVEGGVDWDAIDNPFLQDPMARHFVGQCLDRVGTAWEALYEEDKNPTIANHDLHQALVSLRTLTAESPNAQLELNEAALNAVWSIGSAGYCWRLAEEKTEGRPDEEYLAEVDAVMTERPPDPPLENVERFRILFYGACECANRGQSHDFRVWSGCPMGFGVQFDFLQLAFERVTVGIVPDDVQVTRPDLWYAFSFGLALRDTERWLDEDGSATLDS